MALERHDREAAHRDDAATKQPADAPSEPPTEHGGSEEPGGPYGNPAVDEESLQSSRRRNPEGGASNADLELGDPAAH
jgi:hypothetical protein